MSGSIVWTFVFLALAGCNREELPVPAKPRGDATVAQVELGADYAQQVWFDLQSCAVVARNSKMDWDLAFESAPDGWQVRLNGARLMRVHDTGEAFEQAADTTGFGNTWKVDYPDGRVDSLGFGDWRNTDNVFILDMGYNTTGGAVGLKKVQLLSVDASMYTFRTARMDGTEPELFTVTKDPLRSYTHFSFAAGGTVTIAPPLGQYDLVFTQYTEQFLPPEPYLAYLVTGAVNGFSGARMARMDGTFAGVTLEDTLAHPFTEAQDVIGYDWKAYSFNSGFYEVYADQVYVVHTRAGYFYKLHFTDFYNEQGEKGTPTFEVIPL